MNPVLQKEVRLLLPAWIAAMLVVLYPWGANALAVYMLAGLILGIALFGQEISAGTMGLLLVQPTSRERVWRVKLNVLIPAALLLLILPCVRAFLHSDDPHLFMDKDDPLQTTARWAQIAFAVIPVIIVTLTGLTGGLWTTLVFRQVAAAFWISFLTPIALMVPTIWILDRCHVHDSWQAITAMAIMALYSVVAFWVARRVFLKAQDIPWTGGTFSVSANKKLLLAPVSWLPKGPTRSLFQKEIMLHQTTLFTCAVVLVFHAVTIVVRKCIQPQPGMSLYNCLTCTWVLWMIVPLVVGSMAVAEERRLNTLEGSLCLPVKRRKQFLVKLVATFAIGMIFGGILPGILEAIGELYGVKSGFWHDGYLIFGFGPIWITALCFYASTLTRNMLQAMGVSVGIVMIGIWLTNIQWKVSNFIGFQIDAPNVVQLFGCALAITAFVLAYRNAQRLHADASLWRTNLIAFVGTITVVFWAVAVTHDRTWELVGSMEPTHGQAQLEGAVRPKVCQIRGGLLVLLPDGRLWEALQYETRVERQVEYTNHLPMITTAHMPIAPIAGCFVGASNWVDVGEVYNGVIGLRSDGTLWKIDSRAGNYFSFIHQNTARTASPSREFLKEKPIYSHPPANLEQIGTDSNWKSIATDYNYYYALKNDGTLWCWGLNDNGVLGPGPRFMTNALQQFGTDSNWVAVFHDSYCAVSGVKSDGSVWRWGYLNYGPDDPSAPWVKIHREPVRYHLQGTNWSSIASVGEYLLALDRHTLWASGFVPETVLGHHLNTDWHHLTPSIPVGNAGEWRQVKAYGSYDAVIIKRDGTLFSTGAKLRQMSRHTDWLAGSDTWEFIALAADGTLSSWPRHPEGFMIASRKPIWNYNILRN